MSICLSLEGDHSVGDEMGEVKGAAATEETKSEDQQIIVPENSRYLSCELKIEIMEISLIFLVAVMKVLFLKWSGIPLEMLRGLLPQSLQERKKEMLLIHWTFVKLFVSLQWSLQS